MNIHRLFCKQNYNIVNNFEMMSEFDIVASCGKIPNTHCSIKRRIITDYNT
jgi:hypothetical protein